MPRSPYRLPFAAVVGAVLFGGWLIACDLWTKLLLRWGHCPGLDDATAALAALVRRPQACSSARLPMGLELGPFERHEVLVAFEVPPAYLPLWGLALMASASVITIVVARWRFHTPGDAFALATLWAGVLLHAVPRLALAGVTLAEARFDTFTVALADAYLAISLAWLLARGLAEARA